MKCINYLSLLWFSPQFQLGGGGESTMMHTIIPVYSWHWHSKRTQNTQKCMKCINYLSLLRFSLLLPNCEGSHSAFIYKFKYKKFQYACRHGRATSPEHVRGGGESFKMAALLPERYETTSDQATTADTCHVLHLHANTIGTFVNATLLTYLLNGEILLFIQTWPSQQKRTLGDRTCYSRGRRWRPLVAAISAR